MFRGSELRIGQDTTIAERGEVLQFFRDRPAHATFHDGDVSVEDFDLAPGTGDPVEQAGHLNPRDDACDAREYRRGLARQQLDPLLVGS